MVNNVKYFLKVGFVNLNSFQQGIKSPVFVNFSYFTEYIVVLQSRFSLHFWDELKSGALFHLFIDHLENIFCEVPLQELIVTRPKCEKRNHKTSERKHRW